MTLRVLLVDNDRLLLESLCLALEARHSGLQIELAADEAEALAAARAAPFDLILLDWWLGNQPAKAAFAHLRELQPEARIVVMSGDDNPEVLFQALELGAAGFLRKNAGGFGAMREALDVVAKGGIYLPGQMPAPAAVSPSVRPQWEGRELAASFPHLTPRQLTVYRVLLRGASDKIIARELGIGLTTVKTHVQELYRRLEVGCRAEAVSLAARQGVRID